MPFGVFNEYQAKGIIHMLNAASATAEETFFGPQNAVYRLDTLQAVNSDSIDHAVYINWDNGTGHFLFGSALVPARSGYNGVKPVDLLASILGGANAGLVIPSQMGLYCGVEVAITGAETVVISAIGGDF